MCDGTFRNATGTLPSPAACCGSRTPPSFSARPPRLCASAVPLTAFAKPFGPTIDLSRREAMLEPHRRSPIIPLVEHRTEDESENERTCRDGQRSEERRVGKRVDLGGRRIM